MQQGAVTASDSNCSSNKVKIRTFLFFLKKQYNQCLCNYLTPLVQDSKQTKIKPST